MAENARLPRERAVINATARLPWLMRAIPYLWCALIWSLLIVAPAEAMIDKVTYLDALRAAQVRHDAGHSLCRQAAVVAQELCHADVTAEYRKTRANARAELQGTIAAQKAAVRVAQREDARVRRIEVKHRKGVAQ